LPTPPAFEALLREARDKADIVAPIANSEVATAATDEIAGDADAFKERFADDFSGIDWQRLRGYCEPVATQKQRKSWIYRYGTALRGLVTPRGSGLCANIAISISLSTSEAVVYSRLRGQLAQRRPTLA
jgi:hypothetical protein